MPNKIAKNVLEFFNKCSREMGKFKENDFNVGIDLACDHYKIESPIEQILYCAIETVRELNYLDRATRVFKEKTIVEHEGLEIFPQYEIDKYRVDFFISNGLRVEENKYVYREIIVECDSQEFHERTEQERRYEKTRDRYLISHGYKIFHYTGAEIIKNSMNIAAEIIAFVLDLDPKGLAVDSNFGEFGE